MKPLSPEWYAEKARIYCQTGKLGRQNVRKSVFKAMRQAGFTDQQIEESEADKFRNAVQAIEANS